MSSLFVRMMAILKGTAGTPAPWIGLLLMAMCSGCLTFHPSRSVVLPKLAALPDGLNEVYSEGFTLAAVDDPQHGVFAETIVWPNAEQVPWPTLPDFEEAFTNDIGMSSGEIALETPEWVILTNFYCADVLATDGHAVTGFVTRLRNTPDTLLYAATNTSLPSLLRYNAMLEGMLQEDTAPEYYMLLVDACVTDPCSAMRTTVLGHAVGKEQLENNAHLASICVRSLTDPCLDVAVEAACYVAQFFHLAHWSVGGRLPDWGGVWSGPSELHYMFMLRYLEEVAERLNRTHPHIFREDDLNSVLRRRRPSDAVLLDLNIEPTDEGRDYFEAAYLRLRAGR
jgi:hypothetical protein